MLAPAQAIAGIGSNSLSNIGFLAYNWYTQYFWYIAVKQGQLGALSLLPVHFNFIYALLYLGGVTCGSIWMGIILSLGTAGLLILNNLSAWTSWVMDLPAGYGTYQFFFFGWRTLTPGWRTFFLLWQIGDTLAALNTITHTQIFAVLEFVRRKRSPLSGPPSVNSFQGGSYPLHAKSRAKSLSMEAAETSPAAATNCIIHNNLLGCCIIKPLGPVSVMFFRRIFCALFDTPRTSTLLHRYIARAVITHHRDRPRCR